MPEHDPHEKGEHARQPLTLRPDGTDRAAAILKGLGGAIPIVGSAIVELVNETIPGQRIDRMAAYLEGLAKRLEQMELSGLDGQLKEPANIDLFEDGAAQAIRATTARRRQFIVSAVANGIASESKRKLQYKRLLSLLAELDDEELLMLLAHQKRSAELFEKLRPAGSTEDEDAMYYAMQNKLERLHLLEWKQDVKEVDIHAGRVGSHPETVRIPQDSGTWHITHLGNLLLASLGSKLRPKPTSTSFSFRRGSPNAMSNDARKPTRKLNEAASRLRGADPSGIGGTPGRFQPLGN